MSTYRSLIERIMVEKACRYPLAAGLLFLRQSSRPLYDGICASRTRDDCSGLRAPFTLRHRFAFEEFGLPSVR